jgi:hypothetical protein
MLTYTYQLARAQQKRLLNLAKRQVHLPMTNHLGLLNPVSQRVARFTGSFQTLRQEDHCQCETGLPKNARL